jgi:hypothetical protein
MSHWRDSKGQDIESKFRSDSFLIFFKKDQNKRKKKIRCTTMLRPAGGLS